MFELIIIVFLSIFVW